jgi:hypothetical protein
MLYNSEWLPRYICFHLQIQKALFIIIIIIIITPIEFSLGGSSPYTSTEKIGINMHK